MAEIEDLDVSDAANTARQPEGVAAGQVNDGVRALEGILARWHENTNASIASTGSANAYALAAQGTQVLFDGLVIAFDANFENTGTATLNVDALGAKTIKKLNDQDLVSGDIEVGQKVLVVYDGANFQMLSPTARLKTWSLLTLLSTASGTSSETTAIPAGTLRIALIFDLVSTNGTDNLEVEIGSTTYATVSDSIVKRLSTSALTTATRASGPAQLTHSGTSSISVSGLIELVKHDNNDHWVLAGNLGDEAGDDTWLSVARMELSAAIDRLKITMSGANNFDAGAVHVYTYN